MDTGVESGDLRNPRRTMFSCFLDDFWVKTFCTPDGKVLCKTGLVTD